MRLRDFRDTTAIETELRAKLAPGERLFSARLTVSDHAREQAAARFLFVQRTDIDEDAKLVGYVKHTGDAFAVTEALRADFDSRTLYGVDAELVPPPEEPEKPYAEVLDVLKPLIAKLYFTPEDAPAGDAPEAAGDVAPNPPADVAPEAARVPGPTG